MSPRPSPARGWRGLAVVAATAALCASAPRSAGAQAGNAVPDGDDPPQQRAVLDLVVNEAKAGQVLAVIRRGDVLVPPDALRRSGLNEVEGRREIVGTRGFVSLSSLAPTVTYKLDEKALILRLTAQPESLGTSRLDLRDQERPAFTVSRASSAFFNYGLDWRQSSTRGAAVEAGLNVRGVLFTTSGAWQQGHRFVPGLTSLIIDDRAHLRRLVLGESFAGDRLLGGTILLAGAKVARDYSVDPYFVQYPLLGMSGLVDTPSMLEVYVDGRLVRQERVQPGRFELANVPVPVGSSRTRVLIRDAFGREQEMQAPYYLANKVLARGLQEYEYGVGAPRVVASDARVAYESPVLVARHRYGFTDSFTAGFRLEAREDLASGGPSVNLRAPLGEFELAGAASGGRAGTGYAAALGYTWTASSFSAGLSGRASTDRYRTLSSRETFGEPRVEVSAFAGVRVGRGGSLSLQHVQGETFQGTTRARTSLVGSSRLGRRAHLVVSVARDETSGRVDHEGSVGVNVALAPRSVARFSAGAAAGAPVALMELSRSLPVGQGYGYRMQAGAAGDDGFGSARFEYQSSFGRYEVTQESRGGLNTAGVSIAGGVVAIGGSVFATRPVRDGFGLLRVPGVKGVRGFVSNQEVGRTNGNGEILLPDLLPYYANRVSIADQDVPVGREVPVREQPAAPPYRGGAVVTFEAEAVSAVTGTVAITHGGKVIVPEFGDLVIEKASGPDVSPIGRGGRFYFERLPAGLYAATVRYHGASCAISLSVPASSGASAVIDTKAHSCEVEGKEP